MEKFVQDEKAKEIVLRYCAAWGEEDAVKRRSMFEEVFAGKSQYTDPKVQFAHWTELDDYVRTLHQSFPACRIELTSAVDTYNGFARFAWQFITQDGAVRNEGVDFIEFSEDGKLLRVVGFFGPLAANSL